MTTNPRVGDQHRPMFQLGERRLVAYAVAIGVSLLMLWPALAVPQPHVSPAFLFFYIAVLVSAWIGGLGPAFVAVVGTFVECWYFVLAPVNSFEISHTGYRYALLTYLPLAATTAVVVARARKLTIEHEALLFAGRQAKEAKASAERRNISLLESIGDAFFSLDSEWRFTYVNGHAELLLRKTRDELLGRNIWDEFPDARGSIFEQHYIKVVETHKAQSFETYYAPLAFWTEVHAYPKDDGGISVFFQDVTERHRLVAELEKNAQRFERTFDLAGVGIAHVGLDGRWLRVNQRLCEILGYSRSELLAKTFQDITFPEDMDKGLDQFERLKAGTIERYALEKRYLHKNGAVVWVSVTVSLMRESEGTEYAISVVEDISERKAGEEKLLELSAIVESSEDAIFSKTLQGVIRTWNTGAARMYGYSAAEIIGRPVAVLMPPNRPDEMPRVLSRLAMGEHIGEYETVRMRKDGSLVEVSLNISPVRDRMGRIIGASSIARDITQIKRRTSELESLLNNSPVGLAFFDREYRFLRINPSLAAINGVPMDEHIGRTLREIVPWNADAVEPILDEVFESGRAIEREITGQTPKEPGVNRTWIAGFYPVFAGGPELFAVGAYVIEITDRKEAEQRIQQSEQRLQNIIENLAEGLVVVDAKGAALHWNRQATIDNMTEGVFVGNEYGKAVLINPAFLRILGLPAEASPGDIEELSCLFDAYDSDGRLLPPSEWPIMRVLNGKTIRHMELRMRRRDTGKEMVLSHNASPVLDSDGRVIMAVVTVEDVTAMKQAQKALLQSEKLASVGRMAATIAHEINNPLETVMNAVYLAATCPEVPEAARTSLEMAERELERVAHITRQTLGFYRDPGQPAVMDVAKVIDGVVDVYAPRVKTREIDLKCQTQSGSAIAAVDGEMRQVLSNLIANSIDAVNGSGRIYIRSKLVKVPDDSPQVCVTVADTGVGIPRENLRVIFEPFFTTKAELGTGLGLWVTRELVQKNGGRIRVRSREGCGTVFTLWFPAAHVSGAKAA